MAQMVYWGQLRVDKTQIGTNNDYTYFQFWVKLVCELEMFSYVLRQRCSNTLGTFLKYVAATSCANVFTTIRQRCGNVFATFEYDVEATSGGNIFTTVAQHLSNVPGLRCINVSRQHFHNFRSTLWQCSRNFPGIR